MHSEEEANVFVFLSWIVPSIRVRQVDETFDVQTGPRRESPRLTGFPR